MPMEMRRLIFYQRYTLYTAVPSSDLFISASFHNRLPATNNRRTPPTARARQPLDAPSPEALGRTGRGVAAGAGAGSTGAEEEVPGSRGRAAGADLLSPILARSLSSRTQTASGGAGETS